MTALLLSFIVGPIIMRALRRQSVHQVVREGTPESHAAKGKTPTMGGLIILNSALISIILWGRFSLSHPYLLIAIFVTLWMGVIGLLDDYLKLQQKKRGEKNRGLVERYKLAGQFVVGVSLGWYLWRHPLSPNLPGASTTLPFFKYYVVTLHPRLGRRIRRLHHFHSHRHHQRREHLRRPRRAGNWALGHRVRDVRDLRLHHRAHRL